MVQIMPARSPAICSSSSESLAYISDFIIHVLRESILSFKYCIPSTIRAEFPTGVKIPYEVFMMCSEDDFPNFVIAADLIYNWYLDSEGRNILPRAARRGTLRDGNRIKKSLQTLSIYRGFFKSQKNTRFTNYNSSLGNRF